MEKLTLENAVKGQRILLHYIGAPGLKPDFVTVVETINKASIGVLDYGTLRFRTDKWQDHYHNYYDAFLLNDEEYEQFLKGTLGIQIEYLIDMSENLLKILKETEKIVCDSDYLQVNDKRLKEDLRTVVCEVDNMITSYYNLKEKEEEK